MRRILALLATVVLGATIAMAQSTSPSAPPAQDTNNSATNASSDQNAPSRSKDRSAARPSDTTAGSGQNANAATAGNSSGKASDNSAAGSAQDNNAAPARAENPDASNQANQSRRAQSGVPWLWIAVGILAIIVIISMMGRSSRPDHGDRVTSIDRDRGFNRRDTDVRHDDDIRRVG